MRTLRSAWVLGTVMITGCGAQPPSRPAATAPQPAPTARTEESTPATPPTSAPQGDDAKLAELVNARASFEAFIARADGRPEYAAAVESARTRIQDIDRILVWMGHPAPPTQPPSTP